MKTSEQALNLQNELKRLGEMINRHFPYSTAAFMVSEYSISFKMLPTTSGIGLYSPHFQVPVEILDYTEQEVEEWIIDMVEKYRKSVEEERIRNTCDKCGHRKNYGEIYNIGN